MLENILSMYIKHATGYVFGNICTTCIQPKNILSVPCFSHNFIMFGDIVTTHPQHATG